MLSTCHVLLPLKMKCSSHVVHVYVFITSHPNFPQHIMVHSLLCQQRAVFESKHGKVLSLPVTISTVGFYIIRNDRREGESQLSEVNLQPLINHSEDDSLVTVANWVFLAITHRTTNQSSGYFGVQPTASHHPTNNATRPAVAVRGS